MEREVSLDLSASQRDIWYAQQLMPDVPFAIAYYVVLDGHVDSESLLASGIRAHTEYSTLTMRIAEVDGAPVQTAVAAPDDAVQTIDLRGEADAEVEALSWMQTATAAPCPMDGSLVQLCLLIVSDHRCFWYTRAHHIAGDGYATMSILRRAVSLYNARLSDDPAPELEVTAPERVLAEDRRYRDSARFEHDSRFWSEVLADPSVVDPPTLMPATRPAPASVVVGEDAGSLLDRHLRGAEGGAMPAGVVVAAFAAFIATMTDTNDVTVSLPVSARTTAILRRAGSTMSNVVPVRLRGIGAMTVSEAVEATAVAVTGVLRHQRLRPGASEPGDVTRRGGFGPVVNVMMFDRTVAIGGVDCRINILSTGPVPDLAVNIYAGTTGSSPRIDFEANPDAYDDATLALYHEKFMRYLERFADPACASVHVGDLAARAEGVRGSPITREVEALDSWNSLVQVLNTAVRRSPDSIAILADGHTLTYAELSSRADNLARLLVRRGVCHDDAVVVSIPRSMDSVLAFWAVARAGAVHVPVDSSLPAERVQFIVNDCGATIGLASSEFTSTAAALEWIDIGTPDADDRAETLPLPRAANGAYIIYTSGSTGTPKGVVVTHDGVAGLVQQMHASYDLDTDSRICHFASPSFDTAVVEMVSAAAVSATLIIAPPTLYGGSELADFLDNHAVTHLFATPSALATVDPTELANVQTVVVGGEELPRDVLDRWAPGRRLLNAYGPTETTCSVTMTDPVGPHEPVTIGAPMAGVTLYVLDRRLRAVSSGGVGELYISTAGTARGYLNRYGLTATRFIADPFAGDGSRMFRSGDRVRWDAHGRLEFLGRTDGQVELRGFRVELGEIESALRSYPAVVASACVLRRGGPGDRIDGYVVTDDGKPLNPRKVRDFVARVLPGYMVPSTVTTLDDLPLTSNRKLDRAALPAPTVHLHPVRGASTPTESAVAEVFSEVLNESVVDVEASFLDMGGDSLSATRVAGRLSVEFGAVVEVRDVIDTGSVRSLAALLDTAHCDHERSRPEAGSASGLDFVPLSAAQRPMSRESDLPLYNLPFTVTVSGRSDATALRTALVDVIDRHRMLRTRHPNSPNGRHLVWDAAPGPESVIVEPLPVGSFDVEDILSRTFDVGREHPFRVVSVASGPDVHILACVIHHIAADGQSLAILGRDLMAAYRARILGERPTWEPLAVEYADYCVWQSNRSATHELDFWTAELAGLPPRLPLPADRPRPPSWNYAGGRVVFEVPLQSLAKLDTAARRHRVGRFTLLRSALLVVLAQLTGTSDIVVGTPVSGRSDPRLDEVVGMFVNTVAIRTDLADTTTFTDVIAAAHASEVRALDHAVVPFDDVVDAIQRSPDGAVHPIFQVALSMDVFSTSEFTVGETTFRITPQPLDIAKCDLHLHVTQECDVSSIRIDIVYATALFDRETVVDIGLSYQSVLERLLDVSESAWDVAVTGSPEDGRRYLSRFG